MRALYSLVAVVGLGVASAALAPSAHAGDWSVGISFGVPGVVVGPPAYIPPPRYYAPRPVYVPGYYAPDYYGPSYYGPPRYYRAPVVVYGHEYRDHGWYHHHYHHDGYRW
jgi:hypothetical protein